MGTVNVINGDWLHAMFALRKSSHRYDGGKFRMMGHHMSKSEIKRLKSVENSKRHARKKLMKKRWEED